MAYIGLILEDTDTYIGVLEYKIKKWFPDVVCIRRISEAKEILNERTDIALVVFVRRISEAKEILNERTDIAFIIVDLLLLLEESNENGDDFVKWVLTEERLSRLPMFIISACGWMIYDVEKVIKDFRKYIPIVERTDFTDKDLEKLEEFLKGALPQYHSSQSI